MRNEDLWDMSDAELEAAFKEAQAHARSPNTDLGNAQTLEEFDESAPSQEESDEEVSLDDTKNIEDGLEQPEEDTLEDSDHDTSKDSGKNEASDEDSVTTPDGEQKAPSSDDEANKTDEKQPTQTYKFKANGKDYEFSSKEIVDQFPRIFGQAMDYTKKMQNIKPWRKTIDAIEDAKLSHDDINLMIDVLKGDKGAITEVLKRTGVDTLELDITDTKPYVAKDYGRDDSALAIRDIVDDISRDPEYATTHSILSREWDEKSWNVVAQNPEMIRLLHADVKSGMYSTLQPLVEKLKVYDGGRKSDLDYYKEAAQQHFTQVAEQEAYQKRQSAQQAAREAKEAEQARLAAVKAESEKRIANKEASVKRKAAAPTKTAASRPVVDYLDDSDEAFEEWYKRLQNDN